MIYLDYQATTPLAPEAFSAMEPWLKNGFANPHSAHAAGRAAAAAVEVARDQIAALLPTGGRVIFTSGATEAINLAIMGCGLPVSAAATEHAAVETGNPHPMMARLIASVAPEVNITRPPVGRSAAI